MPFPDFDEDDPAIRAMRWRMRAEAAEARSAELESQLIVQQEMSANFEHHAQEAMSRVSKLESGIDEVLRMLASVYRKEHVVAWLKKVRGVEAGVAQKAREGSGESTPETTPAAVQAVTEQRACNPCVPGSTPGSSLDPTHQGSNEPLSARRLLETAARCTGAEREAARVLLGLLEQIESSVGEPRTDSPRGLTEEGRRHPNLGRAELWLNGRYGPHQGWTTEMAEALEAQFDEVAAQRPEPASLVSEIDPTTNEKLEPGTLSLRCTCGEVTYHDVASRPEPWDYNKAHCESCLSLSHMRRCVCACSVCTAARERLEQGYQARFDAGGVKVMNLSDALKLPPVPDEKKP